MNDYMKRQAEDFLNAAKAVQLPENVQAFAQESVAKTREAYDKLSGAAKDQVKVAEDVFATTQAGAKAVGTKVLEHVAINTDAAFDAAEAIVKARTLPEAARLQAEFVQKQFAAASAQTKELFELSTRVAQQTFQSVNDIATKSFEQMKKAS